MSDLVISTGPHPPGAPLIDGALFHRASYPPGARHGVTHSRAPPALLERIPVEQNVV